MQADIDKVFATFPRLKERATQLAGTMSGGEQQMLAMGRALMARPKVLLLDEPSMGLSPIMVDKIFEVIESIHKQGTTVLLVEQNASRALGIANRGYVMESGEVSMDGPADMLLNDPKVAGGLPGRVSRVGRSPPDDRGLAGWPRPEADGRSSWHTRDEGGERRHHPPPARPRTTQAARWPGRRADDPRAHVGDCPDATQAACGKRQEQRQRYPRPPRGRGPAASAPRLHHRHQLRVDRPARRTARRPVGRRDFSLRAPAHAMTAHSDSVPQFARESREDVRSADQ